MKTGYNDSNNDDIREGDFLKIDLGMRMSSEVENSNYFYVKVYLLDGTWMVTQAGGWKPSGYSDWTLAGTLRNVANKSIIIANKHIIIG